MKLNTQRLKDGLNELEFKLPQDSWLSDLAKSMESFGHLNVRELFLRLKVTQLHPDYYIEGTLSFSTDLTCGRCAELFNQKIDHTFNQSVAHVGRENPQIIQQEEEALGVTFFRGHEFDLLPMLEEQAELSFPYQFYCSESCKGVCQKCGQNLNHQSCQCPAEEPSSVFGALRSLKVDP